MPIKSFLYFILFIFFFSTIIKSHGQIYNFKKITEEQGLVDNRTLTTFQDKNYYIWIGTNGGLSRFDGTSFLNFTIENGLPNNIVRVIKQDHNGIIWVGTDEGVCTIKGSKIITVKDSLLAGSSIRDIYIDSKKNIWFGTYENGLISFDGKKFHAHIIHKGIQNEKISCIVEGKNGSLWLGTLTNGVINYNPKTNQYSYLSIRQGLSNNTVRSLVISKKGVLWIGTDNGLNELKNNQIHFFKTKDGLPSNLIYHLIEDEEENIWIASFGGMSKYDGKKFNNFSTREGLESNIVYHLLQDREKNIWITTEIAGLQMLNADRITYYNEKSGLSNNTVFSILENTKGEIWLGTMGGGINIYHDNQYRSIPEFPLDAYVVSILQDKKRNYWISTIGGGIIQLNNQERITNKVNANKFESNIFSILEDKKGNIWLGTKGLIKWDGHQTTLFNESNNFIDQAIFCLHEDRKGFLWIGTYGRGLFRFDGKKFIQIQPEDGLRNGTIFCLEEDQAGCLWLGTDGGVYKLKEVMPNQYHVIAIFKNGFSDENIISMKFDNDGYLWIGTPKGVNKIDIPTYEKNKTKNVIIYGKEEGFSAIECNQNAILKDSKGYLWFGTNQGAIRYNPTQDKQMNQQHAPIHITDIKLFLENTDWGNYTDSLTTDFNLPVNLTLPWNKNYLTFDFKSINFTNPTKVAYRFRLIGFEKKWSPTTTKTEATYSNLPPGSYTFEVVSLNQTNEWNKYPASFTFTIRKPFWKMEWFYGLVTMSILFSIYGFIAIRTRNLRENQRRLEKEVKRRTIELKEKNEQLEELNEEIKNKNNEITDSIKYAKKIQDSLLPASNQFKNYFPESFIFFKPKDIVSGDFYWINETEERIVVAAVDCTGHGVPGAFISLVGINLLNQLLIEYPLTTPAELLAELNKRVVEQLNNQTHLIDIKDGMDISLCMIDKNKKQAQLASAQNTMYHFRKGEITSYAGNRWSVGSSLKIKPFTNYTLDFEKEDTIYLFTDGYADQFGGPKNKKFMRENFRQLLISIQSLSMNEQEAELKRRFEEWKMNYEQIDDVLVIGIKI